MPRETTPVVAYPEQLQQCPQCHLWFAPNPDARRPTIYCSQSCRQAAMRDRQELAAQAAAIRRHAQRRKAS